MSQVHTRQMGRLVAAGTLDKVAAAIEVLARLRALHIVDYDGSEEGISLGDPAETADALSRTVNQLRAAATLVDGGSELAMATDVRTAIDGDLESNVGDLLAKHERIEEISNAIEALEEEAEALRLVEPIGADLDLLDGYDTLTTFVGTVRDLAGARVAAKGGLLLTGMSGKQHVVGVFVRNDDAKAAQTALEGSGFAALIVPDCEGSVADRLTAIATEIDALEAEDETLGVEAESWAGEHGAMLHCGLELLERDQQLAIAPVRLAVTAHAFMIDGWVEMARADEVESGLSEVCTVVDIEPFKIEAGGGHGHGDDHHHHQEMPPIAFQDRTASKPMELLTDAVGRPAYGRIDPTLFMFFTYPIFFGMMLGDMAYGLVTIGLGALLLRRAGTDEMLHLAGKFLVYIGLGTLTFGYLYAEIAGFEIFSHSDHTMAFLQVLYPEAHHGHVWHASLPFGLELAYPFHRVTMVEDGGNLEHLILLTIYMGVAHVFVGLVVGFRDIMLHGNGHGDAGFVCALFEKGSWMILLTGGFLAAYAFLSAPAYEARWVNPDLAYLEMLDQMMMIGGILAAVGVVMIIWMLYRYHGVPFPINVGLGPIEAVGMMPTVISYVRLFAVGVVGVKIAETGNHMLFAPAMESISTGEGLILVPFLLIGWLGVQAFAWVLGVFSPNIHAARLHFVEWMRQFYDASGEAFKPFGFKARHVEVE